MVKKDPKARRRREIFWVDFGYGGFDFGYGGFSGFWMGMPVFGYAGLKTL